MDNASDIKRKTPQAPSMDLAPESNDRIDTDWSDPIGADHCMNDYDDLGRNPDNHPTGLRTSNKTDVNGWVEQTEDDYKVLLDRQTGHKDED